MPFESQKQRAYFYSQLPKLAKKWEKDTPDKPLPEYKEEEKPNLKKYFKDKQK